MEEGGALYETKSLGLVHLLYIIDMIYCIVYSIEKKKTELPDNSSITIDIFQVFSELK